MSKKIINMYRIQFEELIRRMTMSKPYDILQIENQSKDQVKENINPNKQNSKTGSGFKGK